MNTNNTPYIIAVVIMMLIGIVSTVLIHIFANPGDDLQVIGIVIAMISPTIASLLALIKIQEVGVKTEEVHVLINSRMTEFKDTVEKLAVSQSETARAEGNIQGQAEVNKLNNK